MYGPYTHGWMVDGGVGILVGGLWMILSLVVPLLLLAVLLKYLFAKPRGSGDRQGEPRQHLTACALAAAIGAFPFCAAGFAEAQAAQMAAAVQTSDQGGVKITVEPRGFASEARTWDFVVTLETHTQRLDDDLAKTATLLADGQPSRPRGWEGAPPGGHHRKGVLRFEAVTPQPQAVELQIRRSGEASPRVFRWQLGAP